VHVIVRVNFVGVFKGRAWFTAARAVVVVTLFTFLKENFHTCFALALSVCVYGKLISLSFFYVSHVVDLGFISCSDFFFVQDFVCFFTRAYL